MRCGSYEKNSASNFERSEKGNRIRIPAYRTLESYFLQHEAPIHLLSWFVEDDVSPTRKNSVFIVIVTVSFLVHTSMMARERNLEPRLATGYTSLGFNHSGIRSPTQFQKIKAPSCWSLCVRVSGAGITYF